MVSIADKFGKASVDTHYPVATTVKTARLVAETVLECFDVSTFSATTPVFFLTYKKSTDPGTGEVTIVNQTGWKGIIDIDTNTITNLTIAPGYTDIGNDVGDFVECVPTSYWGDELVAGILTEHAQDGTHTDIHTTSITNTGTTVLDGALTLKSYDGWITETNTWVYVSGTGTTTGVFKIVGVDATGYLQAGMPFKLTQSGVTKYGFITKVAFSTDTTVTCFMAATANVVDNSGIANATITSPAFALPKQPGFGFPLDPAKWTITTTNTNDCIKNSPVVGTWYGDTALSSTGPSISIPIGSWKVRYSGIAGCRQEAAGAPSVNVSLSTSASSESDTKNTIYVIHTNAISTPGRMASSYSHNVDITVTSATTYYLIARNIGSSANAMGLYAANIVGTAANSTTVIKAVCAYL